MFEAAEYVRRRKCLTESVPSGLLLFLGNREAGKNYADNTYPFRQESSFLYFWGLDAPDLAAVIDVDAGEATLFGDDFTVDQIVWMGPQPTLAERAERVGVARTRPLAQLEATLDDARVQGRAIHYLPQYRADGHVFVEHLLGIPVTEVNRNASVPFIKAVVALRAHKTEGELAEIETALETTAAMHRLAMTTARPGVFEREVAGAMEGLVAARGVQLAFPIIFSIHGETLHNHYHGNRMAAGQMAVNDSGAESPLGYAADITRTIPIGGRFTAVQRHMYQAVLDAQRQAIAAIRPGVPFKQVHLLACRSLAGHLADLGCMRGDLDRAVAEGAHALFFQCGLGHMMGLDVHDMEGLGEQYVGYDDTVSRSPQFGLKSLRLARAVEPGFVITVEPGIYMIPQLIDRWKAERRFEAFINYDEVEKFRGFGGIRVEDDVVVTETGCRVLGPPIPSEIVEVESLSA